MMSRRLVIPDIHGCCRTFRRLVTDVLQLTPDDDLYLLGDLIDRGPDSKGVLDFIQELRMKGFSVVSIKGNHEEICFKSANGSKYLEMWLNNGGDATLRSMGVTSADQIPERYQYYLHSLPNYILLDDFVIVHAALNFDFPDPFVDLDFMLWSRTCTPDIKKTGGRRLVCGHTPVTRTELEQSLQSDWIRLDNGCVYAGREGKGSLAALDLDSMKVIYQENIDI
jgi:serine/threonine protein phosphatase 1